MLAIPFFSNAQQPVEVTINITGFLANISNWDSYRFSTAFYGEAPEPPPGNCEYHVVTGGRGWHAYTESKNNPYDNYSYTERSRKPIIMTFKAYVERCRSNNSKNGDNCYNPQCYCGVLGTRCKDNDDYGIVYEAITIDYAKKYPPGKWHRIEYISPNLTFGVRYSLYWTPPLPQLFQLNNEKTEYCSGEKMILEIKDELETYFPGQLRYILETFSDEEGWSEDHSIITNRFEITVPASTMPLKGYRAIRFRIRAAGASVFPYGNYMQLGPTVFWYGQAAHSPDLEIKGTSCPGKEDATITLNNIRGANVPYRASLVHPDGFVEQVNYAPGMTFPIIRNTASAGNYELLMEQTIAEGYKCPSYFTIQIPEGDSVKLNTSITDYNGFGLACYGDSSGTVTGQIYNGQGPFTLQINERKEMVTDRLKTITNLKAGHYTIKVEDTKGCQSNVYQFTLSEPDRMESEWTLNPISCFGETNAKLEGLSSGGIPPYTILDNGSSSTPIVNNLGAGTHFLETIDQNGCIHDTIIEILMPNELAFKLDSLAHNRCYGNKEGAILGTKSGGTAPYRLFLNNALTESLSQLAAGDYSLRLLDQRNCKTEAFFTITEPLPLSLNYSYIPEKCFGSGEALLHIQPSGGIPPYTSDAITSADWKISKISAGVFTIEIKDSVGCALDSAMHLEGPQNELVLNVEPIKGPECEGLCDGQVKLSAQGGTAPYTWDSIEFDSQLMLNNLCQGSLFFTIYDHQLCSYSTSFNLAYDYSIATNLEDTIRRCSGQIYELPSPEAYNAKQQVFLQFESEPLPDWKLKRQGVYTIKTSNDKGCHWEKDLVYLQQETGFEARMLWASEAYEGDTLILIDLSNPKPDRYAYFFSGVPANPIQESPILLLAPEAGLHYLELQASWGYCADTLRKAIQILPKNFRQHDLDSVSVMRLLLYPNPAQDQFFLQAKELDVYGVSVYTSTGLIVKTFDENKKAYSIAHLSPGVYLVKVETNFGLYTIPVLKE